VCADICTDDTATGLSRIEMSVTSSARSSSTDSDGNTVTLTDAEYKSVLQTAGKNELASYGVTCTANGEADSASGQFVYGTDFSLGDLVTMDLGLAVSLSVRVTEATFSMDTGGYKQYQSFEAVDIL